MAAPNLVQVRISRFLRADVHKKKRKKRKRKPINNVKDNSHTGETAHRGKRTDRIIGRERERERESLDRAHKIMLCVRKDFPGGSRKG